MQENQEKTTLEKAQEYKKIEALTEKASTRTCIHGV